MLLGPPELDCKPDKTWSHMVEYFCIYHIPRRWYVSYKNLLQIRNTDLVQREAIMKRISKIQRIWGLWCIWKHTRCHLLLFNIPSDHSHLKHGFLPFNKANQHKTTLRKNSHNRLGSNSSFSQARSYIRHSRTVWLIHTLSSLLLQYVFKGKKRMLP